MGTGITTSFAAVIRCAIPATLLARLSCIGIQQKSLVTIFRLPSGKAIQEYKEHRYYASGFILSKPLLLSSFPSPATTMLLATLN